jgi:hypothetical protein
VSGKAWNSTLRPGKPLERREGLKAKTGLSRVSRLSPVSKKRAKENRERRQLVRELFGDGQPRCARPGCPRLADDVHEIVPRARTGGLITDPSIWAPLCREDNDEATLEPAWAYEAGLLFHSWDAAKARGFVAAWRTTDGHLVPEAPAGGEAA